MRIESIFIVSNFIFWGCNTSIPADEALEIGITDCRIQPPFFVQSRFDLKRSALSTSEKRSTGLLLIEIPKTNGELKRTWQHPTWQLHGNMGPISTDDLGNTYVAPVPTVNTLLNNPEKQNTIFKVDANSGELKAFVKLAMDKPDPTNVFGLLGLQFDCHSGFLLATSVSGSTRNISKGKIYIIDPKNATIHDELNGYDAIGIGTCGITGTKRVYFGLARKSEIWSVEMDKNGKFKGHVQFEISLDLLGPRGDDKARKIRFDAQGNMLVYGVEFNFNLTAPTEKQETLYKFSWNTDENKWDLIP